MKFVRDIVIFFIIFGIIAKILISIGVTSSWPLLIVLGIGIFVVFGRNDDFFKKFGDN